MSKPPSEFRLCYIEDNWAWFTTQEISKQWGDDWNDAPMDCNAGDPYESHSDPPEWELVRVAWYAPGAESANGYTLGYISVEDVNRAGRRIPWLVLGYYGDKSVEIWAGTTLPEFIAIVEANGGEIYMKREASHERP